MTNDKQGLVFISCGQYSPEEIKLGKKLAAAIDAETNFTGYFAQNQTSLEGLSRNIVSALKSCVAFVAVMHHRGAVETPHGTHIRGSVWVEQEIAIAAFCMQALKRDLEVAVYIQRGINREGVRDQLHLNPIEFDSEDEVLDDFIPRLRDGRFSPRRLPPLKNVDLQFRFKTLIRGSGRHKYSFELVVTNTGTECLTDYWSELRFPKAAIDFTPKYAMAGETDTHLILHMDHNMVGIGLYPNDPKVFFMIEYHMDYGLFSDGSILKQSVIGLFDSDGMATKRIEKPFRELQEF